MLTNVPQIGIYLLARSSTIHKCTIHTFVWCNCVIGQHKQRTGETRASQIQLAPKSPCGSWARLCGIAGPNHFVLYIYIYIYNLWVHLEAECDARRSTHRWIQRTRSRWGCLPLGVSGSMTTKVLSFAGIKCRQKRNADIRCTTPIHCRWSRIPALVNKFSRQPQYHLDFEWFNLHEQKYF